MKRPRPGAEYLQNRVPEGVSIHEGREVQDVKPDPQADYLIEMAMEAFNDRRRVGGPLRMPAYKPHEVRLPLDNDVDETVLWLGKGVVGRIQTDFAQIDAGKVSHTDRATDLAITRLKKYRAAGSFGFAFFIQPSEFPDSQAENIDRLRECVAELAVPVMDILLVPAAGHVFNDPADERSVQELAFDAGIIIPPHDIRQ